LQDEIVQRLISWSKNDRKGPVFLQINPTDRCNLKCIFCWQRDISRVSYENEISDARYLEIVDEARKIGVRKITITGGGEPLCRSDTCLKIMKRIKKHGMEGSLITNGTLFTEKSVHEIIEMGWDEVIISLDSPFMQTHDFLRGVSGAFDKAVEAIKMFKRHKNTPKLCIHFVLCNRNYMDIPALFEMAHSLGIHNVFLEPIVTVTQTTDIGDTLKLNGKEQKELPRYIRKAIKAASKYHIENNLESFLKPDLLKRVNNMKDAIMKAGTTGLFSPLCFEPWYNMIIRPNGRVGACCMFDFSGEYCHTKSLEEIWLGEYFTKVRENLLRQELPSYCSKCNPSQIVNNEKIKINLRKISGRQNF
jgi:MoaA/NifB/PqqE/SkfB family radical SAM enzyme